MPERELYFVPKSHCSITPEMCPGSKPTGKLTMIGVTTWDDVIDYCYDEIAMCVDGPN